MIWIDNARIVSIFAVIFLHVAASVVWCTDIGSQYWWFGNLYNSFVMWCVPVFVMISGALLLDHNKIENMEIFYKKRIAKILLPITFWSIFFLLLWPLLIGNLDKKTLTIIGILRKLLSGAPHYHMWFLYMIIILYLFTPFFRKIIANSNRLEIMTLIVYTFLLSSVNFIYSIFFSDIPKLFINWFLLFIPFFLIGHLIRTAKKTLSQVILWSLFCFSSFLTAIGCYALSIKTDLKTGLYFYGYLSITVIPMSISTMYLFKSWQKPIISMKFSKTLSSLSLGIYLIHPIIIESISIAGFGPLSFHPALSIPIIAIIVFTLSMLIAWTISQIPYIKRII